MEPLRIDPERLWHSLMEMARIGATPAGGCNRLTLTDADKAARDLFVAWAREAGCAVSVDAAGNIFARRAGSADDSEPVLTGSHLDTQPTGGKFDGAYGVLAGLEVVRTLNDHGVATPRPLEVAMWTNEEGSRFQPSCLGSRAFVGDTPLADVLAAADTRGIMLGDELERIGYDGDQPCRPRPVHAYLEAHIEQGPILEREGKPIGAVTGVQGKQALSVRVDGMNAHAGTTPMEVRRDPLVAAARMVTEIDRLARAARPDALGTVGMFAVEPGSINVINQNVAFSVDLRCPDDATLLALAESVRAAITAVASEQGLAVHVEDISVNGAVAFDERIVSTVERAAESLGYACRRIISGAGHDARSLAAICPAGMIFIPCDGGLSHNEAENISPEQAAAGADVLLQSLLSLTAQT
ncbi:MAG: M20 family metallo-hydrolase [SAR324 cluster bacterium]|nr:M20 family metallo-hydrolase [SAR324 cluster bacterium]